MSKTVKYIFIAIAVIVVAFLIFTYVKSRMGEKMLKLEAPDGGEVWQAGKTYNIAWNQRKIDRIGIVLVNGSQNKTIAENIKASDKEYKWTVFGWQQPSEDYKIGIFEYPWEEGNQIDYSESPFVIIGPQFASCYQLSMQNGRIYLPSNYPGLRAVFITEQRWSGDLGGLEGADAKCQQQAEENGFYGFWKAFLGDDQEFIDQRLELSGIWVSAKPAAVVYDATCHELIARSYDDFIDKLQDYNIVNKTRFSEEFLNKLSSLWIGRINEFSKDECVDIPSEKTSYLSNRYSFTTTCKDWKTGEQRISKEEDLANIPKCYTPAGQRIDARAFAGLSSGLFADGKGNEYFSPNQAKRCDKLQYLFCIGQSGS